MACIVAAPDHLSDGIVELIRSTAHTGFPGDGKVFVLNLEQAVGICTGECDEVGLQ